MSRHSLMSPSVSVVVDGSSQTVFDVFVTDPAQISIDHTVFEQWLAGYKVRQVFQQRKQRLQQEYDFSGLQEQMEQTDRLARCLRADIKDQYRLFYMLENYFCEPNQLLQHASLPISQAVMRQMMTRYYMFDEPLMRQLVGRKPTSRLRKELDVIAEQTGIMYRSCLRQFENLRRIHHIVEGEERDEQAEPIADHHSVTQIIQTHFQIPSRLAASYARILFLARHRCQASKKKLTIFQFRDLEAFAEALRSEWAYGPKDDLKQDFVEQLKNVRSLLSDRHIIDEYASAFAKALTSTPHIRVERANNLSTNFRTVLKIFVNIANDVSRMDLKDLFPDLMEKVVRTLFRLVLLPDEVEETMTLLSQTAPKLQALSEHADAATTWSTFISVIQRVLVPMYRRYVNSNHKQTKLIASLESNSQGDEAKL